MKILFLAANPVDVVFRLRPDVEYREIMQRIRQTTPAIHLETVQELAVRVSDIQDALKRNLPQIVHFSGHCDESGRVLLEDEIENCQPVGQEAFDDLFRLRKGNIRLVVLNACHSIAQAEALSKIIDCTIGTKDTLDDQAAIIFASHFYQSLAEGETIGEAFDAAVNLLDMTGVEADHKPKLLARDAALARNLRFVHPPHPDEKFRPFTFLPWLWVTMALIFTLDGLRRFLGDGNDWWSTSFTLMQIILVVVAISGTLLTLVGWSQPAQPFIKKAASLGFFSPSKHIVRANLITLTILLIVFGLWRSLPLAAHYYNEKGWAFQILDPPGLSGAREAYRQAIRLHPGYAEAHYNLALVEEESFQFENAVSEYQLAIHYDSRIYPAYNNLARLYLLRGAATDYQNALNILNKAVDLSPQDVNVLYSINKNLGWAYYGRKQYALAEEYLYKALSYRDAESGAAAHCLLAYVLQEQHKPGAADECFHCVSLAPGEKDVEVRWLSDAQDCLMREDRK